MACKIGVFNWADVSVTIDSHSASGFVDANDSINVERPSDVTTITKGLDGYSVFSVNPDDSVTINLKLLQGSPTHKYLERQYANLRAGRGRPMSIKISSGSDGEGGSSDCVMINKAPDLAFGREVGEREWTLLAANWSDNNFTYQ